ncbi:gamma-tubulin complex component 2-like [Porites lutea]|uniref:gamma-tubulin complex component 2-like n=1 Tax=Porites lutea TaxID=51062 RepID=UPI003CC5B82D
MSEFRIHHHVSELLSLLGASTGDGPEVYAEILTKNLTPYVTTQVSAHAAKRKIAETSTTPRDFLKKYDELKSKNVRELDPLVYMLSRLAEDKQMLTFLEKNTKDRSRARVGALASGSKTSAIAAAEAVLDSVPASGTMTQLEVNELRTKLATVTSSASQSGSSPEAVLKALREKQARRTGNLPPTPSWVSERPYLSRDYVTAGLTTSSAVPVSVGTLPLPMQELAIVEDLLFLMMGVEGKYLLVKPLKDKFSARSFTIDKTLEISMLELVQRILPVCSHYSTICRFIEGKSSFEHGIVNHALCAAMKTLLKEYLILVAQLEHQFRLGQLSLQKLWFYIQPCMRTMEILSSIAVAIDKGSCKGGAVLTLLHEKTVGYTGDSKSQDLCLFLTQAACVPYFDILEQWIYKGIISDPYSEFLVAEHGSVQKEKLTEDYNDAYWEQRYTVVRENIPIFLEKVAHKILSTGKYLNVIRQCGQNVQCPNADEIIYTLHEREYVEKIEKAYSYASKTLLDLLMDDQALMARLRSIKHYFLMDLGDFFVQFMDLAEDEMKKNMDDIMPSRLENLLELALRTSTANSDPYKDDLRVDLLPYDLITQLFRILSVAYDSRGATSYNQDPTELQISGLEAFSFDYVVKWPVSLILSKKALTKYQMLFRHLFYARHVERQLCNVWVSNKRAKQFTLNSSHWYAAAFALRQRMLHFVQTYEHYMMFEVLEPSWHLMEKSLKTVTNIDGVLENHNDFLDRCLKDCMLTNPELLKVVSKLMLVCVTFTNCMQRFTQSASVESQETDAPGVSPMNKRGPPPGEQEKKKTTFKVVSDHVDQMISGEDFERTIQNFDSNFALHLMDLLEKLSHYSTIDCEHQMLNIIARLDHNGYYTAQLEKRAAGQDTSGPPTPKTPTKSSSSLSAAAENQMRSAASLDQLPDSSRALKYSLKPPSLPDMSDGKGTKK